MFFWQHWLICLWITAERSQILSALSVTFLSEEPVYVALGKTLVLKAQFELQPAEEIRLVTWDRKGGSQEVRLATNKSPTDSRVSVERDYQHLRLTGVQNSDYGDYTVTVTDNKGNQKSATVSVQKVQSPPVASLSLKCTVQSKGTWWDSPTFTWLVDGVNVTNDTVLSEDGSSLYLQDRMADSYKCIVDSNQGTSIVQSKRVTPGPETSKEPCLENKNHALITAVVIETLVIIVLIGYVCWIRRNKK